MSAKIIDGKAIAREIRAELKARAQRLKEQGVEPGLAVVMVGNDPASQVYVRKKVGACAEVGIRSQVFALAETASQEEVLSRVLALNRDPAVHGILVQLPLPRGFDARRVLEAVAVEKDVDGFHLYNVGGLVTGVTVFPPCTPYGVMRLLEHEGISVWGKSAVVVGASNIVGKPMALLLLQKGATITVCNSKTHDLAQFTRLADILVVAVGKPGLITAPMVKEGAVVIDVGITRLPGGRLTGDVDFEAVARKASYITPVPGGVGPMTVTMLLANTIAAAERVAARLGQGKARATGV